MCMDNPVTYRVVELDEQFLFYLLTYVILLSTAW
jgi:hypothetical protein